MAPQNDDYKPKHAVSEGLKGALTVGAVGVFGASIQNALQKRNVGAWSVVTRGGGMIGTFAAVGGVYEFSRCASANLRQKDDFYNVAIGGFLGGSIMGINAGGMSRVLGYGSLIAVVLSAIDYTGGHIRGPAKDPEVDEYERKERLRKNRRRPLEETIAEIGEGRGIYPPGYEERRRERIKQKYGIEVKTVSADPNAA